MRLNATRAYYDLQQADAQVEIEAKKAELDRQQEDLKFLQQQLDLLDTIKSWDAQIEMTKHVAETKKVGFIDLNTPLDHHPELFTEKDGVHPNKRGYLEIAKIVAQHLTENK